MIKIDPEFEQKRLWEMNEVWNVLTFEEKEFITRNVEICQYKKNQVIHHEGDVPTHVMMLGDGKLRVYKEGVGNKQQIIRMLKPYDLFAYRAVIAGETYNTAVSAFEQSVVYKVPKDIFLDLINRGDMSILINILTFLIRVNYQIDIFFTQKILFPNS